MNVAGIPALALILFAPWFLVLAALYSLYPRQPRSAARRRFDSIALLLAFAAWSAGEGALAWCAVDAAHAVGAGVAHHLTAQEVGLGGLARA